MPTFISAIRALARDLEGAQLKFGTTRAVIVVEGFAIKIARRHIGRECNLYERRTWEAAKVKEVRRKHLCPVLWCADTGAVLIMRATTPPNEKQFAEVKIHSYEWWEGEPMDRGSPFEGKLEDWGVLNGEIVAVDYAALSQVDPALLNLVNEDP